MTTTALTNGLQQRDTPMQIRATTSDTNDMTVAGIGVPYDTEIELSPGVREIIAAGAVQPRDHRMLYWRHRDPIGLVTAESDTAAGWTYEARISDTPTGREAHTLARDGVITKSSIGFYPIEWEETHNPDDGSILIRHTRIDVQEVSLVPIPAYDTATITTVRHKTEPKETPMHDTPTEFDAALDEIRRELSLVRTANHTPPASPMAEFRSFGHYVKALAAGDDTARRAFDGMVSGDSITHPQWVGDIIKLVEDRHRLTGLFRHTSDLPPEGNMLEYGRLAADTLNVKQQDTEGDTLTFGKISFDTTSAPVKTYGGWTAMSRQAIERSSINVIDTMWRAFAMRYGRAIELATRTLVTTAHTTALAGDDDKVFLGDTVPATLAAATADDWLATVLALVEHFDGKGFTLDGIIVSKDVLLALAKVPEDKKMLQINGTAENKGGRLDVSIPSANLYNLPVTYAPYLSAGTALAYDTNAIRIQESPGAPFRLTDENITNLTNQFSVYGYAAHYQQLAGGLVAIDLDQ